MITSDNWRTDAPNLCAFDYTDPTARLIAADYVQERDDDALAAWLRALPPIGPLDFARSVYRDEALIWAGPWRGNVYVERPAEEHLHMSLAPGHPAFAFYLAVYATPGRDGCEWYARVAPGPASAAWSVSSGAYKNPCEALLRLVLATRSAYPYHRGAADPAARWAGLAACETVARTVGAWPSWWRGSF